MDNCYDPSVSFLFLKKNPPDIVNIQEILAVLGGSSQFSLYTFMPGFCRWRREETGCLAMRLNSLEHPILASNLRNLGSRTSVLLLCTGYLHPHTLHIME